ncbi:PREDICTED: spindle assembly checkpoint component MAD1 [Ipomoea nil]|uniref:spindle assembly checkpoint component MAD1 n=1 Tax=Ipomoea nil TaxID=35883 RepID=UPI0009014A2E|nr:PREDICTED: spindle assembly checkpoint component MAD1 [Ipomoea nil]
MSRFWASLSTPPESPSSGSSPSPEQSYDDSALEGVAANVKLLLKLIQDHKDACKKEKKDGRRMLRVATMMTILDNVRTRIQKCQSFGNKNRDVVLAEVPSRRSYTDLRSGMRRYHQEQQQAAAGSGDEENARLRKELSASLAARKSMEVMCSSLGKEKEIMAAELSRKAHELNGMEELINDLKAQNRTLMEKAQECASEHKDQDKSSSSSNKGSPSEENVHRQTALQERNKTLSERVQIALDGYRSMKRRLKEVQEENAAMRATMEEMGAKASAGLERIRGFKEKFSVEEEKDSSSVYIRGEIAELEHMFECFEMQISKHGGGQVKGECVKPNGEIINPRKPSVLA